jgi:hypothetical protein
MNTTYIIYGVVALLVVLLIAYFMMSCKKDQVRVNGKCYQVLVQKDPTSDVAVANLANIMDNNSKTGAAMTTAPVVLTLASKDGTPMKTVMGARIVATIKKADPASTDKVKLVLNAGDKALNFEFPQTGKVVTVGQMFATPLANVASLTLNVPANVTLHEVQIF